MEQINFHANLPDDVLVLRSGSRIPIPDNPPELAPLPEGEGLEGGFVLWVKLRDEAGEVIGTGVEIEWWPAGEVKEGYLWDTCWVLTLPARGALYVHQHETIGIMQDILEPMRETGEDWEGNWRRTSTSGPGEDGRGVIVGGSGQFAGARGTLVETNNITKFTVDGVQTNRCELTAEVELDPDAGAAWPWR